MAPLPPRLSAQRPMHIDVRVTDYTPGPSQLAADGSPPVLRAPPASQGHIHLDAAATPDATAAAVALTTAAATTGASSGAPDTARTSGPAGSTGTISAARATGRLSENGTGSRAPSGSGTPWGTTRSSSAMSSSLSTASHRTPATPAQPTARRGRDAPGGCPHLDLHETGTTSFTVAPGPVSSQRRIGGDLLGN